MNNNNNNNINSNNNMILYDSELTFEDGDEQLHEILEYIVSKSVNGSYFVCSLRIYGVDLFTSFRKSSLFIFLFS